MPIQVTTEATLSVADHTVSVVSYPSQMGFTVLNVDTYPGDKAAARLSVIVPPGEHLDRLRDLMRDLRAQAEAERLITGYSQFNAALLALYLETVGTVDIHEWPGHLAIEETPC